MLVAPSAAPLPRLSRHPTVAEYARHWMIRVRLRVRARSAYLYDFILETYLAPLGPLRLRDLRRADVQALVDTMLADGKSIGTVRNALATLSALLNEATHDELIARNVAMGVARRLKPKPVRPPTVYQPEQISLFLATARTARPDLAPLFALCAGAGLRVGEARGLQRWDVDLTERTIRVVRQIHRNGMLGEFPKGNKRRVVPIVGSLVPVLGRLVERREPWCFPEVVGATGYQIIRRALHRIAKATGLKPLSPKAFRHTFGSTLIARGESPEAVRRMMGHADLRTTISTYGSHFPMQRSALLDEI